MLEFIVMDYAFPIYVLLVSLLIELLIVLYLKNNSKMSRYVSIVAVSIVLFSTTSLLILDYSILTVLLFIVGLFRCINLARVVHARMNNKELYARYSRTMGVFAVITVVLLYLQINQIELSIQKQLILLSFAGSILLFITTTYSMFRWRNRNMSKVSLTSIPTVSVCIPARNETQDLPECIESVLSSTYPKLEIIVLDDCSHDKTPAVIKEYAHKGVRFVKGQEPADAWIAKNSAMNKLFDEARGEVIVFAGVDVRFSTNTVQNIVEQLEYGLLDMISVLPQRRGGSEYSVFIQPLRYWWELSVPRLLGKRPPALSTLWAIRSKKLTKVGGFNSVKRSVRPEAHFAKKLSKSYRFVLSGSKMGLTSVKGAREQFDTALRMRYPQARRRPESVFALFVIEFILFAFPIVVLISSYSSLATWERNLAIISIILVVLVNIYISILTVQKAWIFGLISLPFLIVEEWYMLIRSMLAYEFGSVKWKERNICLPMLQVEKELPKLK